MAETIFWSMLGIVVGVVATCVVASRVSTKRTLSCSILNQRFISKGDFFPDELFVQIGNITAKQLTVSTVRIWNSGMTMITSSDILGEKGLRIVPESNSKILTCELQKSTNEEMNFKCYRNENGCIQIAFDFCGQNEGACFRVVHDGSKIDIQGALRSDQRSAISVESLTSCDFEWSAQQQVENVARKRLALYCSRFIMVLCGIFILVLSDCFLSQIFELLPQWVDFIVSMTILCLAAFAFLETIEDIIARFLLRNKGPYKLI